MDITFLIALGTALVVAADMILRVVAPKTVNTVDDAVLAKLDMLMALLPGASAPAKDEAPKA